MKEKLVEMDLFVSTLTESIPENSLLVVLGDHGMTEEGDHGKYLRINILK
jgi:phosphopentomutase